MISDNLRSFNELKSLQIDNFFTFNNSYWGNMKLSANPTAITKYREIFQFLNFPQKEYIHIAADNNDNVQLITEENLKIYQILNQNKSLPSPTPIFINCDAIITKENIPVLIAPADCPVICITGIDKKENKRFLALIHSGLTGTILEIITKTVNYAHQFYEFENSSLQTFIFPHLQSKNYAKDLSDERYKMISYQQKWKDFLEINNNKVYFNFSGKIIAELKALGINKINLSDLDTYAENQKNNLYSLTYLRDNNLETNQRFLIGVCINNAN